jgi:16S rRNA (cytidine1402-2'-O)-methyltransferase
MGTLSIVATPIGNLGDITLRALETLKKADVILCEDTRVTSKLLRRYEISKPLVRCDERMEEAAAKRAIDMLSEGKRIALVSDAGTPGISDPGHRLVARVRRFAPEATIEAIPGPSALTAALSIAGIHTGSFLFLGFLPHKKGRQTALKKIAEMVRPDSPQGAHPVVLYESPHRILKLLGELGAVAPEARVTVARELTKLHEELLSGTPSELAERLEKNKAVRGEFVVIVSR